MKANQFFSNLKYPILFGAVLMVSLTIFLVRKSSEPNIKVALMEEMLGESNEDRFEQEFLKMRDPQLNSVPMERLLVANKIAEMKTMNRPESALGIEWEERGPNDVGGRTRALIFDKNDPSNKKVWAGGASGGLWVTDDITSNTPNWRNVSYEFQNLAITAIAQDPSDPNYIYVGTGEYNTYNSPYRSSGNYGNGIWSTSNGGTTWTQIQSTSTSVGFFIFDIAVAADGSIYLSSENGLSKSKDHGSNWNVVRTVSQGGGVHDIEIASDGSVYAVSGFTYDAGTGYGEILFNYSLKSVHGNNVGDSGKWGVNKMKRYSTSRGAGQSKLAIAPSNPNKAYVVAAYRNTSIPTSTSNCPTIFRLDALQSINSTTTWTELPAPKTYNQGDNTIFTNGQAYYDLEVCVDNNDENTVYIGGLDVLRSNNGGQSWCQISTWSRYDAGGANSYSNSPHSCGQTMPNEVHADIHKIIFSPGSSTNGLIGCDGGIYYTTDLNAARPNYFTRNKGYNVTQFYAGDLVGGACSEGFLGGTQDNGTIGLSLSGLNDGKNIQGGDGSFCHIDQNNDNLQIASYVRSKLYFTSNNWNNTLEFDISGNSWFINPTDYDENNKVLYAATQDIGYYHLIKGGILDGVIGTAPTDIKKTLPTDQSIAYIKVDPSVIDRIWIATFDRTTTNPKPPHIFRVDNASSVSPTIIEKTNEIASIGGGVFISSIDIDPKDPDHILVTSSNFGVQSVWISQNGGNTWVSIEGDLPDFPVRCGIFNPLNSQQIILGTEVGVWSSSVTNGNSTHWEVDNIGMGLVRVEMLKYRKSDFTLAAFTYGRGIFTTNLTNITPPLGLLPIARAITTGTSFLAPNSTAYFYSNTGNIIGKIDNLTSILYGCTPLSVTRGSTTNTAPVPFIVNDSRKGIMPRTFEFKAIARRAHESNTTSLKITLYFDKEEVEAWETGTGKSWSEASFVKCSGAITLVTPNTPTAGGQISVQHNEVAVKTDNICYISATFTDTDFSSLGIGTESSVLPLELLNFTVKKINKTTQLDWITAHEVNIKNFDIERMSSSSKFEKIGTVKPKSNNSSENLYTFLDANPLDGVNYYRLKINDLDGTSKYSKTISLDFASPKLHVKVFPNPTRGNLSIDLGDAENAKIRILNISGMEVLYKLGQSGQTSIDISNLPNGMYFVEIATNSLLIREKIIKK